ncbi:MAG: IS3 family transposase [Candidatus Acidiferrales bacterium]
MNVLGHDHITDKLEGVLGSDLTKSTDHHVSRSRRTQKRKTAWSDAALLGKIREVLAASPFYGEGHRKVWARLRFEQVRTSKARVLRLMRDAQLLAPSRTLPKPANPHTGKISRIFRFTRCGTFFVRA